MKVVILTGNQGNQKALCHKIAEICEVSAIVVSENIPRKKPTLKRRARTFVNRVNNRLAGREFVEIWFRMLAEYEKQFPDFPAVPIIRVKNVNDRATVEALEKYAPDITAVSGTNLIGGKIIEEANKRGGIVNLHTGISPYVKGGPNCTNWCLAKNWFHLIGNTIMWLDIGIDTGNIIATEQTPLDGGETLFDLHWKVMQHAHEIYTKAISLIAEGRDVPSVSQKSITEGNHFNSVDWNASQMRRALVNFRHNYKNYFADAETRRRLSEKLQLFPIN
ncbi:MAG: formyltransferase family protein [Pyrinomonadaceae bacterium]